MAHSKTLGRRFARHLREAGPSTNEPFDDNNAGISAVRYCGARKFNISGVRHSTQSSGGFRMPVYYLPGEHSPGEVIDAYFEANPNVRENHIEWGLHQKIAHKGEEWAEASADRLGPFDVGAPSNGGMGGECMFCGEEYPDSLPDHLRRSDCGGV